MNDFQTNERILFGYVFPCTNIFCLPSRWSHWTWSWWISRVCVVSWPETEYGQCGRSIERKREREKKKSKVDVFFFFYRDRVGFLFLCTNDDIPHRWSSSIMISHGHRWSALMIEIFATIRIDRATTHTVRIAIVHRWWWHSLTFIRRIIRTRSCAHVTTSHARIWSIGTAAAAAATGVIATSTWRHHWIITMTTVEKQNKHFSSFGTKKHLPTEMIALMTNLIDDAENLLDV